MKKKVLILCNTDPDTDPRPNRMIHYLKDEYQVTVLGRNQVQIKDVESFGFLNLPAKNPLFYFLKLILGKIARIVRLLLRRYEDIVWSSLGNVRSIQDKLLSQKYDLVISHDILLMPLARHVAAHKQTKLMLDAREFYPRAYDEQWQWRLTGKHVNEYLCQQYLPSCDKVITVSDGLAQEYKRLYNIDPDVVMSLPAYKVLPPMPADKDRIRMIYHGIANFTRKTEMMIELMDYVDERFTLDLMLVVRNDSYYHKIVSMAKQRKNVRVIPPVHMQDIIPFTNQYDVGVILYPPANFNVIHALPNKLFEYIQARLALAIGPGIEMKKIVEQYDCGIISSDFLPFTLAQELNKLTTEKIMEYKKKSDVAAHELSADANRIHVLNIIHELIGE